MTGFATRILDFCGTLKPKTLSGRIFAIMLVGAIIITGLSVSGAYYVVARDSRFSQAYNLGFTIRELIVIAEKPNLAASLEKVASEFKIDVKVYPAKNVAAIMPFHRPAQQIPMPARFGNVVWPETVKVHFKESQLSSAQRERIEDTQSPNLFFAVLSREISRLGVPAFVEIGLPNGTRLLISQSQIWAGYMSDSMAFVLFGCGVGVVLIVFALLSDILAKPFKNLTMAILENGDDVAGPHVPAFGPTEARSMVMAYNDLRDRISRMLDDRTRMLAGISHDLRTPSTRLRLRAEFIDNDELRQTVLRDLDEMDSLLNDALDFLGDWIGKEDQRLVDFTSLLEAICDDYSDLGRPVSFEGPQPLQFSSVQTIFGGKRGAHSFLDKRQIRILCRPGTLRRAFTNLIENALKYGHCAKVSLDASADYVWVTIRDEGPGINEAFHEKVFLPFYRLETSRARATGGSGLGLAIVKTVIDAHDGKIGLRNMPNHQGLEVTIELPRRVVPKPRSV